MPHSAPRLCSHPGCTILTKHSHYNREAEQRRGSSTARGYDARWQKLRNAKLRDEPLCRIHLEILDKIVAAETVDHIVPKAKGGTDDWDNLQSLCSACNYAKGDMDNSHFRASIARKSNAR